MSQKIVRGACPHDCPDTCSFLVTVDEGSGRAIKIRGDLDHGYTRGFLCKKVNHYLERTYSAQRVLRPLVRAGPKGDASFREASWDEALELVTARLKQAVARDPQSILPYSYGGTLGLVQGSSMDRRFFHRLGASLLNRSICANAGTVALDSTIGSRIGPDIADVPNAKLVIVWGSNTLTSNIHLWPLIEEARDRGAKLVVIDPIRTRTAERADEHLPIAPGTDAALALGMMHVIFREGLEDRAYLESFTEGHEALRARALEEWPLSRAAAITRLPAERIEALARAYASTKPSFIRLNYGLQRHAGGGAAVRAIVALPAVTGAFRDAGGGALLSTSSAYPVAKRVLERPELIPSRADGQGPRTINMSTLGDALDPAITFDPPIDVLFVYGSNPAAVAPDQEKVLAGLSREDLFVVVHEIFLTDTARYADVVLPATTQLEQLDIHKSYGHLDVLLSLPAIAPIGGAVSNTELFRRLARRMGFEDPCFSDDDETLARSAFDLTDPRMKGITLEALREKGPMRLSLPAPYAPFANGGFARPSRRMSLWSKDLEDLGQDPLIGYVPPAELSDEVLGRSYPLALLSPPAHGFLNTTFANLDSALERDREPTLELHPEDARARDVSEGELVRVFNARGSFWAKARITDRVRPGVVCAPSIWWLTRCVGLRNANAVVGQRLTDLGSGATFYDTRVQLEKCEGPIATSAGASV
ncbi:MAG: molybdopterin oxidoreductase family protein [Deltaproteobacteria bacterium]|nr:molybdopterin oxidoreductase family protein [Deltaproteobacteria bacterium]